MAELLQSKWNLWASAFASTNTTWENTHTEQLLGTSEENIYHTVLPTRYCASECAVPSVPRWMHPRCHSRNCGCREPRARISAQSKRLSRLLFVVIVFCFVLETYSNSIIFLAWLRMSFGSYQTAFIKADQMSACMSLSNDSLETFFLWRLWKRSSKSIQCTFNR